MTRRNQPWEDQGAQHSKYRKEQEQKPVKSEKAWFKKQKESWCCQSMT